MSETATSSGNSKPTRYLIIPVLLGLLVFMAYGASQSNGRAEAAPYSQASLEVDVDLKEWELLPDRFDFQQGDTVVFNITNTGRFPHNLEVSNTAQHLHSPTIAATEATTLEVTFEHSGTYVVICAIPGHADLGMTSELTVAGDNPAPTEGEFLGIAAMRLSPRSGTEVEGASLEVKVTLHDFTLDANSIGGANMEGEGHWALFLDGGLVQSIGEPAYLLEGLSSGDHIIRVELRNNDGTPVDPALEASSDIAVAGDLVATPSVGGVAPGSAMLAAIAAFGLLLLGSGGMVLSRRRE